MESKMGLAEKTCSRREFLEVMGIAAVTFPLVTECAAATLKLEKIKNRKPKNIIFILSDDHRFDFMGFMNKPKFLKTPNMDRMAAGGVNFKKTFVSTSLCSPSRTSILTGKYSHRHGVVTNTAELPKNTMFFSQYLQQCGYQTAFIGKRHIGSDSDEMLPGFDKWISFKGQGTYNDPVLNIDGKKVEAKGYITDLLTDHTIDWLDKRKQDKPFFVYLSHKAGHMMVEPAARHAGKYADAPIEYPASMADTEENYKGKPAWVKRQRKSWHGVDGMYNNQMSFDTFYRKYCETLLGLDENIGRVLDYLDKSGLAEDTVVFYMSDNGFLLGEHGLIDKRAMYEESMRVPLLAYCPGYIKAGSTVEQMVQNIDIAPTILDIAGVKTPDDMDGKSFLPLLMGDNIPWRDSVFYEYFWERHYPQTPTMHGVRTDRYKYIHYYGIWDADELYDLHNDPNEMNNLINSPEHRPLVKELNDRMYKWLEKTNGMAIPLTRDIEFKQSQ